MCSKAARAWSTRLQVGAIVSAVADLVGCGEDCIVGRAWFVRWRGSAHLHVNVHRGARAKGF